MTNELKDLKIYGKKGSDKIGEQYVEKTTFKNGVVKYDTINGFITEDIFSAQELYERYEIDLMNEFNVFDAYKNRDERTNKFVGTYGVVPNLLPEYRNFLNRFTRNRYDKIIAKVLFDKGIFPTFDEWKSGKKKVKGRNIKLGKWLQSHGVSSDLVSYYASQNKVADKVYLTISDNPTHVLGMTSYSDGTWDSCMGLDYGGDYNVRLAGALNDTKLLVCFMHKDLEDIEDLEGNVSARVLLRLFKHEGKDLLISTNYYGSSHNQQLLDSALVQLEPIGVMSKGVKNKPDTELKEPYNGDYKLVQKHQGYVNGEYEEYYYVPCPVCNESGKFELFIPELNDTIESTCPTCNGTEEIEYLVSIALDEEVMVESEVLVTPYVEGYKLSNNVASVEVNSEYIRLRYDSTKEPQATATIESMVFGWCENNKDIVTELSLKLWSDSPIDKEYKGLTKVLSKVGNESLLEDIASWVIRTEAKVNSRTFGNGMLELEVTKGLLNQAVEGLFDDYIYLSSKVVSTKRGSNLDEIKESIRVFKKMICMKKVLEILTESGYKVEENEEIMKSEVLRVLLGM